LNFTVSTVEVTEVEWDVTWLWILNLEGYGKKHSGLFEGAVGLTQSRCLVSWPGLNWASPILLQLSDTNLMRMEDSGKTSAITDWLDLVLRLWLALRVSWWDFLEDSV
jgi:hypothetical protein